jgi:hypothetical protein
LTSFSERLIGAAKLDVAVYEEVEADTSATGQAMGVVLLSSVAGGLGASGIAGAGLSGFVLGGIAALVGWGSWAFLTYVIGTRVLAEPQTRADVGELLRTTGFAQAPGILRAFGGIAGLGPILLTIVSIWMLIAMVIAVRQALDYSTTFRAVGVCLIGWCLSIVISLVLLSFLGLGATAGS